MLSTLMLFPQAQNVSIKKKTKEKKKEKDDEYISFAWSIFCHILTWSAQTEEGEKKKAHLVPGEDREAAPGNADA